MNTDIPVKRSKSSVCLNPRLVEARKRRISYYLPSDLVEAVNTAAMDDARGRTSGRMFNPSAIVERILRAHFDALPKRTRRTK